MSPHSPADSGHAPFPYSGPDDLRPPIEAALQAVVDPEVALSIVDVGLVYGVTVVDRAVRVVVTMTSVACPVTDTILDDIEYALTRALPADVTVDVELVWEPAWTTERMSARAKAFMGW